MERPTVSTLNDPHGLKRASRLGEDSARPSFGAPTSSEFNKEKKAATNRTVVILVQPTAVGFIFLHIPRAEGFGVEWFLRSWAPLFDVINDVKMDIFRRSLIRRDSFGKDILSTNLWPTPPNGESCMRKVATAATTPEGQGEGDDQFEEQMASNFGDQTPLPCGGFHDGTPLPRIRIDGRSPIHATIAFTLPLCVVLKVVSSIPSFLVLSFAFFDSGAALAEPPPKMFPPNIRER